MVDKVAMLLSSDWFFQYWDLLGINIDQPKLKESLQSACRDIVKNFISNAQEYWHISFAPSRVKQTRTMFERVINEHALPGETKRAIIDLISDEEKTDSTNSDFIMAALTERLRAGSDDPETLRLSMEIREIVIRVFDNSEASDLEWSKLCEKSRTTWDRYLRQLTPHQPTYLADFLVAEVLVNKTFQRLWLILKTQLNADQQEELLTWYRVMAKSLMGFELPSPRIN